MAVGDKFDRKLKITPSQITEGVTSIHETSTPADLTIGAIIDGQYLKRDGTTVVSAAVTSGISTGKSIAMAIVFS